MASEQALSRRSQDYAEAFAAEVQREHQRTPRAKALQQKLYETDAQPLDAEKRKSLEALTYAVGLYVAFGEDLSDADELRFSTWLRSLLPAGAQ